MATISKARSLTTAAQFEKIANSLGSCELVRGEVVSMSPGGFGHSRLSANIAYELEHWARQCKCGRVLTNEAGIVVDSDPDTVRGADVAYYSYVRLPKGSEPKGFLTSPPNLVVEIIGAGQAWSQVVEKAGEYLSIGVDRVWVVDPAIANVHVFRCDAAPLVFAGDEILKDPAILPGFSLKLVDLFGE